MPPILVKVVIYESTYSYNINFVYIFLGETS